MAKANARKAAAPAAAPKQEAAASKPAPAQKTARAYVAVAPGDHNKVMKPNTVGGVLFAIVSSAKKPMLPEAITAEFQTQVAEGALVLKSEEFVKTPVKYVNGYLYWMLSHNVLKPETVKV